MAASRTSKNTRYVNEVISNTQSNIIKITEDKLENKLNLHVTKIKKSQDWVGGAGIFVTIVIALLTCDFKKVLGIKPDFWYHMFVFASLVSLGYLIYTVRNAYKNRTSVAQIIEDIKK